MLNVSNCWLLFPPTCCENTNLKTDEAINGADSEIGEKRLLSQWTFFWGKGKNFGEVGYVKILANVRSDPSSPQ